MSFSTQPCRQIDNCRDPTCQFSHTLCKFGPNCKNPFCGYHSDKDGKIKSNYVKFVAIWMTQNAGYECNMDKFFLEIKGLENVMISLKEAYETINDINQFTDCIKEIKEKVDLTFAIMHEYKYDIVFTNPHTAVNFVLNNLIPLYDPNNEKIFDRAVYQYFAKFEKEIEMAKLYWTQITGINFNEYYIPVIEWNITEQSEEEVSYEENFPDLSQNQKVNCY